jgi:hypothetical protein
VPPVMRQEVSHLQRIEYMLVEMPDAGSLDPASDAWSEWWWLAYGGMWGRMVPIRGPVFQPLKWSSPVAWEETLEAELSAVPT